MESADNSVWSWVVCLLVSVGVIIGVLIRPCWKPTAAAPSAWSTLPSASAPAGVQIPPASGEAHMWESYSSTLSFPPSPQQLGPLPSLPLEGARSLGQRRTFWVVTGLHFASLLLLLLSVLAVHQWEEVSLRVYTPSRSRFHTVRIVLGLASRSVLLPAGSGLDPDDSRWRSGSYATLCTQGGAILGCNFSVQAAGGVIIAYGITAILGGVFVLLYLMAMWRMPQGLKDSSWAGPGWVWRCCLLQGVCMLSCVVIWAASAHAYLANRMDSQASAHPGASFLLCVAATCVSLPLLSWLHHLLQEFHATPSSSGFIRSREMYLLASPPPASAYPHPPQVDEAHTQLRGDVFHPWRATLSSRASSPVGGRTTSMQQQEVG